MSRKVYIQATVRLVVEVDEGVEIGEVMDEVEITLNSDKADLLEAGVVDHEVTDSK